jgi:secreted trypsin-like serine protease
MHLLSVRHVFTECATNHRMLDGSNSRIVGGQEAIPNALPWQVFIRIVGTYRCGGSILNKRFVVSAMHCFHDFVELDSPGEDVIVGAGIHDLCSDPAISQHAWQVTHVKKIHHQDNYDPKSYDNDLAILELLHDFRLNENIKPVCLPTKQYTTGDVAFVSGWGHMAGKSAYVYSHIASASSLLLLES